jgi:hypothetical protein
MGGGVCFSWTRKCCSIRLFICGIFGDILFFYRNGKKKTPLSKIYSVVLACKFVKGAYKTCSDGLIYFWLYHFLFLFEKWPTLYSLFFYLNTIWSIVITIITSLVIRWGGEASWSWWYGSWIYNYLCNQCILPLKLWIRTPFMARCIRYNIMWSSLSVTCDRSVVFSVKHHQPKPNKQLA